MAVSPLDRMEKLDTDHAYNAGGAEGRKRQEGRRETGKGRLNALPERLFGLLICASRIGSLQALCPRPYNGSGE